MRFQADTGEQPKPEWEWRGRSIKLIGKLEEAFVREEREGGVIVIPEAPEQVKDGQTIRVDVVGVVVSVRVWRTPDGKGVELHHIQRKPTELIFSEETRKRVEELRYFRNLEFKTLKRTEVERERQAADRLKKRGLREGVRVEWFDKEYTIHWMTITVKVVDAAGYDEEIEILDVRPVKDKEPNEFPPYFPTEFENAHSQSVNVIRES